MLQNLRTKSGGILVIGNHPAIMQSILDFDSVCGKKEPSIVGCITGNRKAQKFFFGRGEVLIPCWSDVSRVPKPSATKVRWMLNVQSGRRAYESTVAFFTAFPDAYGGHIFAENLPEKHATDLLKMYGEKLIAGPSGVGLLIPGALKLGAIGGVGVTQLSQGKLAEPGAVAVVATSGGMTNELITAVASAGKRISFALCIGGDRFPISSLTKVLSLAESDPATKAVVYFGELGGVDEYEIAEMIRAKKLTKPVLAYVAGIIDEAFDEHMQFGHAKALVARNDESARAKRSALRAVGVTAPETFGEFLTAMQSLPETDARAIVIPMQDFEVRQKSILSTREVANMHEVPVFVKNGRVQINKSFAENILTALLGRAVASPITTAFGDAVFSTLIDHGGEVSGAVNTMITARAGKDLTASLASGILTIGPRFGGAVNTAAEQWLTGVHEKKTAHEFVAERTTGGKLLSGIGHKKYRVGVPDPRVEALAQFATLLTQHPHYDFAREVEKITTGKNGSLILNVDGIMAALLLDILTECERCSEDDLCALIDAEFFNALFVIPRTVGFTAHFMEQKKNDEGLFRLPEELLFVRKRHQS